MVTILERKALSQTAAATSWTVLAESRIPKEQDLQDAFADNPQAFPHKDLGLGPLMTLGVEAQVAGGGVDLVLADSAGQIVVCEVKRGSENADARKVVAQLLDYGASLWQQSFDDLADQMQQAWAFRPLDRLPAVKLSRQEVTNLGESGAWLIRRASLAFGAGFDSGIFRAGIAKSLDSGEFTYVYLTRDVDSSSQRIFQYLAKLSSMRFYAVEVDHFKADEHVAVLVPRVVIGAQPDGRQQTTTEAEVLTAQVAKIAEGYGITPEKTQTGARFRRFDGAYIGAYRTSRGMEFGLQGLRDSGCGAAATHIAERLGQTWGRPLAGMGYPYFASAWVLERWAELLEGVIRPFFSAVPDVSPSPPMPTVALGSPIGS